MPALPSDPWEIRARFEDAWCLRGAGAPPPVEDFLPATDAPPLPLLVALLGADQYHRTRQGLPCNLVDDYLVRFPTLSQGCPDETREDVLALFTADFDRLKSESAEPPTPARYLRRVPDVYFKDLEARLRPGLRAAYELAEPVGEGTMGEVHAAFDRELGRRVALKRLRPELSEDRDAIRQLLNEATITAALDHPAIIPVHRLVIDDDGRPGFAMRLVARDTAEAGDEPAGELSAVIAAFYSSPIGASPRVPRLRYPDFRGRAFRRLLGHFLTICDAMAFAHRAGYVHRDLKPDNILVGRFGETYVTDWGLAARLGEPALEAETVSEGFSAGVRNLCGSPAYMSPEQARGDLAVDERTDVCGLGAILYQILTARAPYDGPTLDDALENARNGRRPEPRAINPRAPRDLVEICAKALAVDPSDRYPNVQELRADLERWLAGEPVETATRSAGRVGVVRLRKTFEGGLVAAAVLCLAVWLGARVSNAQSSADGPVAAFAALDGTATPAAVTRPVAGRRPTGMISQDGTGPSVPAPSPSELTPDRTARSEPTSPNFASVARTSARRHIGEPTLSVAASRRTRAQVARRLVAGRRVHDTVSSPLQRDRVAGDREHYTRAIDEPSTESRDERQKAGHIIRSSKYFIKCSFAGS